MMELPIWIWWVTFGLLGLGSLLGLVRIIRGPSFSDRVAAFDVVAFAGVGTMISLAISLNEPYFLDVSMVWALVTFLATIAFARFFEKRGGTN